MKVLHAIVIIAIAVIFAVLVLSMPSSKSPTPVNITSLKPIERVISVTVVNTTLC